MFYQVNKSKTSTMKNPVREQKVTIIATGQECIVGWVGVRAGVKSIVVLTELDGLTSIKDENGFIAYFSFDEIELTETDPLIEVLDSNQANDTEETPELTQKEKEIAWQADLDATQRLDNERNSFYL